MTHHERMRRTAQVQAWRIPAILALLIFTVMVGAEIFTTLNL